MSAVLPRYAAVNNVGYIAMLRKDRETAIRYFNEAIDEKPSYYETAERNLNAALSMGEAVEREGVATVR